MYIEPVSQKWRQNQIIQKQLIQKKEENETVYTVYLVFSFLGVDSIITKKNFF